MICSNTRASGGTQLFPFSQVITHTHTHILGIIPHGGQDDLVEQVLVELFGHFQAGPLHSYRSGQTQDNAEAAEHAEHRQVPDVTEAAVLQPNRRRSGLIETGFNSSITISVMLLHKQVFTY